MIARKIHMFLAVPAALLFVFIAVTGLLMSGHNSGARQYYHEFEQQVLIQERAVIDREDSNARVWHKNLSYLTAYFLLAMTATGMWLLVYPRINIKKTEATVIKFKPRNKIMPP